MTMSMRSVQTAGVRRRLRAVVATAVFVASVGCVGPARTDAQYLADIANTATSAVSAVESARLTIAAVVQDMATGPYVSRRLTEDEHRLQSTIVAFSSVQPPSEEMDQLRSEVLATLQRASAVVSELRIAAYSGRHHRLADIGRPLPELSERLARYERIGAL